MQEENISGWHEPAFRVEIHHFFPNSAEDSKASILKWKPTRPGAERACTV